MPNEVSWSEAARLAIGIAGGGAGLFGLVKGIGAFFKWLVLWTDERAIRRDAKLAAWEASLDKREHEYRHMIEAQLAECRRESAEARAEAKTAMDVMRADFDSNRVLMRNCIVVVIDVAAELELHAPNSAALGRARALLKTLPMPAEEPVLSAMASRIDQRNAS